MPKFTSPYRNLHEKSFWKNYVQGNTDVISDIHPPKWPISRDQTIMTMGSCFAQHISKELKKFKFAVPFFDEKSGIKNTTFSANYGNIYTVLQALQLIEEVQGKRESSDRYWQTQSGYVDPLRPTLFIKDFSSPDEVYETRLRHLQAVKNALRSSEILIFTLGLTEAWAIKKCGTVLPTAPGTVAGDFNEKRYEFINFTYRAIYKQLSSLCENILEVREEKPFKLLLTVSPVPLTATASGKHVLQATCYSKAVLRSVAGDFSQRNDFADYFPSFEIINSPKHIQSNFEPNLRSVSPLGVSRVMQSFAKSYNLQNYSPEPNFKKVKNARTEMLSAVDNHDIDCEEALLEKFSSGNSSTNCSEIVFFGNSHIASFIENSLFEHNFKKNTAVPYNLLSNNPFEEIKTKKFKQFYFNNGIQTINIPDANKLVIVGFGLFGDGIIRSLGNVNKGFDGCIASQINVQLDETHEIPEYHLYNMENALLKKKQQLDQILEHADFEKILWIVAPDFTDKCAEFRLGKQFVDGGYYKSYKNSYSMLFERIFKNVSETCQFIFHTEDVINPSTGFTKNDFGFELKWDVHVTSDFYTSALSKIKSLF
ncbi:GSCFA domain-containing protein [Planktomarina temperata]|nr:GSCFA domain-containing protein [Planktomarina temperata]